MTTLLFACNEYRLTGTCRDERAFSALGIHLDHPIVDCPIQVGELFGQQP